MIEEIKFINRIIADVEPIRDNHTNEGLNLLRYYNVALDSLRILESKLRTAQHRNECEGCGSIYHIGQDA